MTRPSKRGFEEPGKVHIAGGAMTKKGATPPSKSPKLGSRLKGVSQ
jgi:hypothetical protein